MQVIHVVESSFEEIFTHNFKGPGIACGPPDSWYINYLVNYFQGLNVDLVIVSISKYVANYSLLYRLEDIYDSSVQSDVQF